MQIKSNGPRIAIATSKTDVITETFIRQHIELLPFDKTLLSGYKLTQLSDGTDLTKLVGPDEPAGIVFRLKRKLVPKQVPISPEADRARQIAAFLSSREVKVVLAEYGPTGCVIADSCQIANVPLVVHFHGYDAYETAVLERNAQRYVELFEQAAAVVAVSDHMRQQLLALGAHEAKLHCIPYFVDPHVFRAIDAAKNPPVFIAVGRFVEKKAPHLALLAFHRVLSSVPSAKLIFVGDGPLLSSTKQLARALDLENSVTFLGAVPHTEIHSLMSTARCFVQHSVVAENGDREGTPVALLEAQATGLPAVSTRHTGILDVVAEGETGFLVDEFDIGSMARCMTQVALEPTLSDRLSRAAAARVRSNFGRERTLDRLTELLARVALYAV